MFCFKFSAQLATQRCTAPKMVVGLWMVLLLTFALLLSQTLGFMHSVLHAQIHGSPTSASINAKMAQMATPAAQTYSEYDQSSGNLIYSLFSSHHGDKECRLFDQVSHGSAAPLVAALAIPVVLSSIAVVIFEGEALACWAALFEARGPPLTS